jgi:very-short-patch-repair endonuclease
MSLSEDILNYLAKHPGLKAKEIAKGIGADKSDVNKLLYGPLKGSLVHEEYRWSIKSSIPVTTPVRELISPSGDHARICRYLLDCIASEAEAGVSVFASSRFELDYAEIGTNPFSETFDVRADPRAAAIIKRFGGASRKGAAFLGYPVRLRRVSTGMKVEPVLLFPFEVDADGRLALVSESPLLNIEVLKSVCGGSTSDAAEEATRLYRELGLLGQRVESPDPDEIVLQLHALCSDWDWRSPPHPDAIAADPPLSAVDVAGIHNRAVVVGVERPPFTQGLEAELAEIGQLPNSEVMATQLGRWIVKAPGPPLADGGPPLLEPLPMNLEQRLAVQRAMTQPLTVITGPPGTGKSQVVTSILVNAAYQGKRVLFASKNHKAVDVVEDRVNGIGDRPILIRVGPNQQSGKLASHLGALLAGSASLQDRERYQEATAHLAMINDRMMRLREALDEVVAARNRVDAADRLIVDIRAALSTSQLDALDAGLFASSRAVLERILRAAAAANPHRAGIVARMLWRFRSHSRRAALEDSIRAGVDALGAVQWTVPPTPADSWSTETLREFESGLARRVGGVEAWGQYRAAADRLAELPRLEDLQRRLSELSEQLASASEEVWKSWVTLVPSTLTQEDRERVQQLASVMRLSAERGDDQRDEDSRALRQQGRALLKEVSRILNCWAVTSLSARNRIPFDAGFFDLLVIDEASQCDIASAVPLLYRAKAAVIIGDPEQLRHISSVSAQRDRKLLSQHDLASRFVHWSYSTTSLFDLAATLASSEDIVMLRDHHRSHEDIIAFSNKQFYGDRLRVATRRSRLRMVARDEPAVRWIEATGRVERPFTGGAVNRDEAKTVVRELRALVLGRRYEGTIGVISPFRAQANEIQRLVAADRDLHDALLGRAFMADTVHRFQGDERDVMFFSTVVSAGMPDTGIGFLRSNPNLFNVAITRARAALWAIGDSAAAMACGVDYLAEFAVYARGVATTAAPVDRADRYLGADYPVVAKPELVSDWERAFYRALFAAGLRPIPQYPEDGLLLDFALFDGERKLDIEVDGERYHRDWTGELCRRDVLRNHRLFELGWEVMRFWVPEIRDDMNGCVERVLAWKSPPSG